MNIITTDGNLFLNSISRATLGNISDEDIIFASQNVDEMRRGRGLILKTFLNLCLKSVSDIDRSGLCPTHFNLVWDRKLNGKYHKTTILDKLNDGSSYKSDRSYVTQEDLENAETEEEKKSIKAELCRSKEFLEARSYIQKYFGNYGINSYSYPGWEADDIAFIWGKRLLNDGGSQIHYSSDSDWKFGLVNPRDLHYQPLRSGKIVKNTMKSVREDNNIPDDYTIQDWAAIEFSARGSHNNLLRTIKPEIKRFTKKWREKLYSEGPTDVIGNMKRFNAQKETFDVDSFDDRDHIYNDLYNQMITDNSKINSCENIFGLISKLGIAEKDKFSIKSKHDTYKSILLKNRIKLINEKV